MQTMKRIFVILIFLTFAFASKAQLYKMVRAEYFIDADPGFGQGTAITLSNDSLVDMNLNVDISSLQGGQHFLFIRAQNDSGYWSTTALHNFIVSSNATIKIVDYMEYFVDTDPGFGQATSMPLTSDSLIDNTFPFNISSATGGAHILGVRARDSAGGWSQTVLRQFVVSSGTHSPNVVKVEYAFDTDPGFGNASSITLTPDSLINKTVSIDVSSLSSGSHILMIRAQDANGGWSQTATKLVVTSPATAFPPITKLRYGFDTAPLMGQGLSTALVPDTLVDQTVNLNVTSLTNGYHKVFFYAQDSAKTMSLMSMDSVYVGPQAKFSADSACIGDSTFITNLTTGSDANTVYKWLFDNTAPVNQSTLSNVHYLFTTAGTHTVSLIVHDNIAFADTLTKQILVHALPTVTANALTNPICYGLSATLAGGGATTYTWNTTATTSTISVAPLSTTIYTVTGTDIYGCINSGQITVTVNPLDSLSGTILDALSNPVTAGKIYLFQKRITNIGIDTMGFAAIAVNGYYTFPSLAVGNYYLEVYADTNVTQYKNSIGTYYSTKQNPYRWDSAIVINHNTCTGVNDLGYNIKIIQIPVVTPGPGIITGIVTDGPGYGQRLIHSGGNLPMGAPLKGVDIKLGKNPGGNAAARTTTDSHGHYSFPNVPLGNYKIYVDIPNYGMDSIRDVSLTSLANASVHNDYYVDSNTVRVVPTYSATAAICQGDSILLEGGYQHVAGMYYDTLSASAGYDSLIATILSVNAIPTLTVSTSNDTICSGNSATLTAIGNSISYLWSVNAGSATTSTVSVSPTTNTTYTVTGTLNSCPNKKTIKIIVNNCIGINHISDTNSFTVYPNPANNSITVKSSTELGVITIYNSLGEIIYKDKTTNSQQQIDISKQAAGIYILQTQNTRVKLIKE